MRAPSICFCLLVKKHWDSVPCQCQRDPRIFWLSADSLQTQAEDPIHAGIFTGMKATGIGPSMPFARYILELDPGFGTIGFVPCAYDWTNMREWARNSTKCSLLDPGTTLYQNLIERERMHRREREGRSQRCFGGRVAEMQTTRRIPYVQGEAQRFL